MRYINMLDLSNEVETVDQCETFKEARELLKEYRLAFSNVKLWVSQRSTKTWKGE